MSAKICKHCGLPFATEAAGYPLVSVAVCWNGRLGKCVNAAKTRHNTKAQFSKWIGIQREAQIAAIDQCIEMLKTLRTQLEKERKAK